MFMRREINCLRIQFPKIRFKVINILSQNHFEQMYILEKMRLLSPISVLPEGNSLQHRRHIYTNFLW